MNRQGVKGPQALWLLGNMPDILRLQRAEAEKDMKTGDYDTLSHILPFHTRNCQAYGERVVSVFFTPLLDPYLSFSPSFISAVHFWLMFKTFFLGLYFFFFFFLKFFIWSLCAFLKSLLKGEH